MTDPITPILDTIQSPADMKTLSDAQLRKLADEVRAETISAVSVTGGHLGAGLGVVELTVALHAVFDAPKDKIISRRRRRHHCWCFSLKEQRVKKRRRHHRRVFPSFSSFVSL